MAQTRTDAHALRALLARLTEDVAADAVRTDGQIPAERLEALGRLARFLEMRDAAAMPFRRRSALTLVGLGTLACVSVLLFARVSGTEVEMQLKVSEVSFVLPTVQAITDAMSVSALGVSGLRVIDLPEAHGGPGQTQRAYDVLLTAQQVGGRVGTVSVGPISVSAGSRVSIRKLAERYRYRLLFRSARPDLAISVHGPVRIIVPSVINESREFAFPSRIGVELDSQQVSIDFATAKRAEARALFLSPLPAESLFLFRIDQFEEGEQTLVRRV
jgi:hypothetical protein